MRPHIFVTAEKIEGLRSVEEVKAGIRAGHLKALWETLCERADADSKKPPFVPTDPLPERTETDVRHANRDWPLVNAVGRRVQRAALAYLIGGEVRYKEDALRQYAALFDPECWPEWRDLAHPKTEADLRTGMLCCDLGLAYDWLHVGLTAEERRWVLEGIDRCGLQPYLRSVEAGAYWAEIRTNWLTSVVGGASIGAMAIGEDHARTQEMLDFSLPRMTDYLSQYGAEGEFNESVDYSGATLQPVAYFMAHRYATRGGENRLAQFPFPETCRWTMYCTLPPGRFAAFGDASVEASPCVTFFAAVADATQDGVLQRFYLDHASRDHRRCIPWELLWFDANLQPASPEGRLPGGRAYPAHGACVSSRTDWDARSTACVVYGKGGSGAEIHGNHDAGQVCIDGYAERLIVDLGSPPGYAADYGGKKYEYYNAAASGHNALTFGGREMRSSAQDRAETIDARFDDTKGGYWSLDLTGMYDGVHAVRRTVVHLHPGIVAVLDVAALEAGEEIALHWHTISPSTPDSHRTLHGAWLARRAFRARPGASR